MFCWSAKSNPTYRYFAQEAHISHDAINLSAKTSAGNRDRNKNVFEILMAAVDIYSLRKINNASFEVGGQYHRNM